VPENAGDTYRQVEAVQYSSRGGKCLVLYLLLLIGTVERGWD